MHKADLVKDQSTPYPLRWVDQKVCSRLPPYNYYEHGKHIFFVMELTYIWFGELVKKKEGQTRL